jgi:hypothetical protein
MFLLLFFSFFVFFLCGSETPTGPKGKASPKTYMFSMAAPFVACVDENGLSAWPTDEKSVCRSSQSLRGSLIWQVPREHDGAPFIAEEAPQVVDDFLRRSVGEVEQLIERKELAVNQRYGSMSNTLLMYAVLKDRKDLCELLIDKNANIMLRNNHNLSALQWARINGSHKEIVELLLKKGAE